MLFHKQQGLLSKSDQTKALAFVGPMKLTVHLETPKAPPDFAGVSKVY